MGGSREGGRRGEGRKTLTLSENEPLIDRHLLSLLQVSMTIGVAFIIRHFSDSSVGFGWVCGWSYEKYLIPTMESVNACAYCYNPWLSSISVCCKVWGRIERGERGEGRGGRGR